MNSEYLKILKNITADSRIIITSHRNPDGDAVGSAMALYHTLKHITRINFIL